MEKRIVIGGCRTYCDYDDFKFRVGEILHEIGPMHEITILSGHCRGVDRMAERFADELGCKLKLYVPEWGKYRRGAGVVRNGQMVKDCDFVIAFWDGKSRGTANLIDTAEKLGKRVIVCEI